MNWRMSRSKVKDVGHPSLRQAPASFFYAFALFCFIPGQCHFAAAQPSNSTGQDPERKLSFGNLRKLRVEGGMGRYVLNGVDLPRIVTHSIYLSRTRPSFRVKVSFLSTVLISRGNAVQTGKRALLKNWKEQIPLVAQILDTPDSIGSMKVIVYDLIDPGDRKDLFLQEELVFLWSANQREQDKVGDTILKPPMPFVDRVVDVQYRGLETAGYPLVSKILLQILYVRDKDEHFLLGGFLIVSQPNGEYQFYLVPHELLQRMIIEREEPPVPTHSPIDQIGLPSKEYAEALGPLIFRRTISR